MSDLPANPLPAPIAEARQKCALVMKGGGVKGLAYVGALEVLQDRYEFDWFLGTSAGAIAAVLLAAGFSVAELKKILEEKDFTDFLDAGRIKSITNLIVYKGLYAASNFTVWLDGLLAEKLNSPTRVMLSDLPFRATVFASSRDKSVLTFDRDNDVPAAFAVRCSMSIPYLFMPQSHQGFWTFDGGIQHNYPLDILVNEHPDAPFLSLYLGAPTYQPVTEGWVFSALINIATAGADAGLLKKYLDRTVIIDPSPISTFQFKLSEKEKEYLVLAGRIGAIKYLKNNEIKLRDEERRREQLKQEIEGAVASKRRLKRSRRWKVGIALAVALIAFITWRIIAGLPKYDSVTLPVFAKQYEAKRALELPILQKQYTERYVTWDAVIHTVYPNADRPAYWIEPIGGTDPPPGEDRFHAIFNPPDFTDAAAALLPGQKIKITGQIQHIGSASVLLGNCRLLEQLP